MHATDTGAIFFPSSLVSQIPMTAPRKFRVLFLSFGNSCRSQIAEGWARHVAHGRLEVRSAGIEAHGKNPHAIKVMHEAGIDITGQASRRLTPEMLNWADLVITVCARADRQCPVVPGGQLRQHWAIEDPAIATGSETLILGCFRACSDVIRLRVYGLIRYLQAGSSRSTG